MNKTKEMKYFNSIFASAFKLLDKRELKQMGIEDIDQLRDVIEFYVGSNMNRITVSEGSNPSTYRVELKWEK